jgi:hypothetical protein
MSITLLPRPHVTPAESLIDVLRREYADVKSEVRYFDSYFDLDGDGKDEAIVYIIGPDVCGSGGCETLIFALHGTEYKMISRIGLSRPPIIVLSKHSNGWRDLAVFVAGGGILPGYFAKLQFDGKAYPDNPTVDPAQPLKSKPAGAIVIPEKMRSVTEGKLLKSRR